MKRLPMLVSFLLFLALCASVAAWTVHWMKPSRRVVAAAPMQEATPDVKLTTASALFGTPKPSAPPAANYALKGVIVGRTPGEGVAIIAVDGRPAQAVRVGADVVPGVSVKEVHAQFALLADGSGERRVDLVGRKSSEAMTQIDASAAPAIQARPQPAATPTKPAATGERPPRNRRGVPSRTGQE